MVKWTPSEATKFIREIARSKELTISYKLHAKQRMSERDLIVSDVLFALKNGSCLRDPLPTTRAGFNKYEMICLSPNSSRRQVRVVVVPMKDSNYLKIVTVMWVDEKETVAGNVTGEYDE